MIRLLQSIAEHSGDHLKSTCDIILKRVRSPENQAAWIPADGSLLTMGIATLEETGTLIFTYSESVCRHIAQHIMDQRLQDCDPAEALDTILEMNGMLVAAAQNRLKKQNVSYMTTPAVAGMIPNCQLRMNANTLYHSVTLETDRGTISCCLVMNSHYRAASEVQVDEGRKPKILIIDDCAVIRSIIERTASKIGFETESAENGTTALVKASQFEPDIITMDITMPGMDGITCLRKMRSLKPDAVVIMVTGSAHREQVKQCLQYGANDYMLKPFRAADLEQRLQGFLKQRTVQPNELALSAM